ncbi:MAG: VCBS repeat-containing protein [Candidatus Nealsonbacteria bacterium]|nr:VCBS repeat-containing protein [Candidatus Nealsonbacteria bacterium]
MRDAPTAAKRLLAGAVAIVLIHAGPFLHAAEPGPHGRPWAIHAIDDSSRGADGVRLADVNGDRRPDITTGWEEGGITRVYLHPGPDAAGEPWPAVTVGTTPSVEDAVFVDLDADGRTDVVTCCEGGTRTMFVHWAPKNKADYLEPEAWTTEPIPASAGAMQWMFCLPMQVDGRHGIDLIAAAKGSGAAIGWFESPEDPRKLDGWKWHPVSPAGWIMSLQAIDLDADGDLDVVTTDRRGPLRGCRWLENPGPGKAQAGPWQNRFIGGRDHEVMFMTAINSADLLVATKPKTLLLFHRPDDIRTAWKPSAVTLPEPTGTGKGVAVGDIDRDGRWDVVFSCEGATGEKSGLMWLAGDGSPFSDRWTPHEISGPTGIKFDRLELLDVDTDGDLDVLACEESEPKAGRRRGLGVFWYENPTPRP